MKLLGIVIYLLFFACIIYIGLEAVIIDLRNPLPKFTNRNEKIINNLPILKTRKIVYNKNLD